MDRTRVVVLGAGIIGAACARDLALAGFDVLVVDRAGPAAGTTSHGEGNLLVSDKGPVYLETNTLPGLTKASLYPKALKAQGIDFVDFLKGQIELAERRARA